MILTGCGEKAATVSGTVSYDGKLLSRGDVTFIAEGEGGKVMRSIIDSEGKYKLQIVPGKVKITVSVPSFHNLAEGKVKQMDPAKFGVKGDILKTEDREKGHIQIPSDFSDAQKTPLHYTVTAGEQVHNISIPKK